MQLQAEGKAGKYRGLIHLAVTLPRSTCVGTFLVFQYAALSKCVRHSISREEGLAALWKGHLPAQVLSVTYGFVRCQLLAPF